MRSMPMLRARNETACQWLDPTPPPLRHHGTNIGTSDPPREAAASANEHEILVLCRHGDSLRFAQYKRRIAHGHRRYARRCLINEDDRFMHPWPQQHRVGRGQSNQSDPEQEDAGPKPAKSRGNSFRQQPHPGKSNSQDSTQAANVGLATWAMRAKRLRCSAGTCAEARTYSRFALISESPGASSAARS